MTQPVVEIRGLKEILDGMKELPGEVQKAMDVTMEASLLTLWENVPPYPAPPQGSTYTRTGTLGKTLGSSFGGGRSSGTPDVYEAVGMGAEMEGHFGTSLEYAPYVIGDGTQAAVHAGRWWTMQTIATKSTAKILGLWSSMTDKLAAWLDKKGA